MIFRAVAWAVAAAMPALPAGQAKQGPAQGPARYADDHARDLIQRSQAALVHGRSLRDLRALVLRGRLRVMGQDDTPLDGFVEIKVLLPDRYVRVDTFAGVAHRSGFAGRVLLTPSGDLRVERARLTRLLLGAAAYTAAPGHDGHDEPLTLRSTGEDAFQDTAAVDVTAPAFSARLVMDAQSLVPLRLVYFGDRQVSTVVSFANRRAVSGIDLPFRITTQTPDRVLETLMFDEILVDPELGAADFHK